MTHLPAEAQLRSAPAPQEALNAILESLARIRFGSIELTVHDGKVVQLDITEKRRLDR